jgi:ribosomal-protein-alanine N-acetyltransferase
VAPRDPGTRAGPRVSPTSQEDALITTERLVVRRFGPGDLVDFLAYQGDPVVRAHMPGEAMSDAAARRYLAEQATLDERATGHWHAFAVEHRADARVIGDLGVFLPVDPEGTGDLGFQFRPDHHRQGYGLEATSAFLAYLFGRLALHTVTAACDAANTASYGLMERLGMRRVPGADVQYELRRDDWLTSA